MVHCTCAHPPTVRHNGGATPGSARTYGTTSVHHSNPRQSGLIDRAVLSSGGLLRNAVWSCLTVVALVGCERERPPSTQRSLNDQPPVTSTGPYAPPRPADERTFAVPDQRLANLEVLSEDIARDALISEMRRISQSLGVRCNACHATATSDYASDVKAAKRMARRMMRMVEHLNAEAFTWPDASRATCYMCHRGEREPLTESPTTDHAPRSTAGSSRSDGPPPRPADSR